ncbi:hypothetical protein N7540_000157 [Penicillium herquei]|nr:hypothetical protein N7540_000157 [Penicillium herquei]
MASTTYSGTNYGAQIGNNYGTFTAEFHAVPERPETPPIPLSTVPFARDQEFVSRDTLLHQIREKNSVPGSRIALVGLGGVGKSQLAIEYSYQIRSESPATWVFWIHASNHARFEQSFRDIAHQVKIPGRRELKANIFELVENWLRDEKKGKWLCILDNADDPELLSSPWTVANIAYVKESTNAPMKPLLEYIPRSQSGSVIITSRSREVALKTVKYNDLIEIRPMEQFEALALLQNRLGQPEENQETRRLVEELEFMPLAIVQAASYIRARASRYSIAQYLQDFQASDREATKLLRKEADCLDRDWEAKNSILVTWQISFDYVRRRKSSATDLLSLMCFFDRQEIPENLIRLDTKASYSSTSRLNNDSSDGESSESDKRPNFEDDIIMLRSFSFISTSETGSFFTMHRLIQLATRAWLKSQGEMDQWRERFISILYQDFPAGEYADWGKCQPLFPHVRLAVAQQPKSKKAVLEWATVLYRGACFASGRGNVADLRRMASKSREQRMKWLGDDDEEAVSSTAMLAEAYFIEGLWKEAEQLQIQVMETYKMKLGADHPNTLTSMAILALTYMHQGQWEEAKEITMQVVETESTNLGVDHPSTLRSMDNLASIYIHQGRWEEAEKLIIQVLEISEKNFGVDHPNTLQGMANLMSTYMHQGRWEEAERLIMQVMEITNLASTYSNQGRLDEAEQLQVQVMETSKTKLGMDHPNTLTSMNNLASTYMYQGRWNESEQLKVQVVEARKKRLGADHPDTLTSMANLALTYMHQGRWDKAEQLQVQVVETSKTKLGMDHPNTLTSMNNLASTYMYQGRWDEAEQLSVQVLESRKKKLGVDHPETLTSMANLAFTWKSSGRNTEAIELLQTCLNRRKDILGNNHPHTSSNAETLLQWKTEALDVTLVNTSNSFPCMIF